MNALYKHRQREIFTQWYAQDLKNKLDAGIELEAINISLALSIIKPLHAQWQIQLIDFLKTKTTAMAQGFEKAGLMECFNVNCTFLEPANGAHQISVQTIESEEIVDTAAVNNLPGPDLEETSDSEQDSDDDLTITEFLRDKRG